MSLNPAPHYSRPHDSRPHHYSRPHDSRPTTHAPRLTPVDALQLRRDPNPNPYYTGETLAGFNIAVGGGMGRAHKQEATFARAASHLGFVRQGDVEPSS